MKGRGKLEETLVKRLDEFCWVHRFENRTKLIRHLLDWAMDHYEKPKKSGSSANPSS